jgi:alpha-glucosidase
MDIDPNKPDGSDPLFDRDEVHEIYRQWRKVFNEYDPPRVAVAEASAPAHRLGAYASEETLGQAFNFDLLHADWNTKRFKHLISNSMKRADKSGSSNTWVLSNHDVVRHPTRYGLPDKTDLVKWYISEGKSAPLDAKQGIDRARASTMLILALPGSTYLYQGEEIGLFEVADTPREAMQDPQWFRNPGKARSRDGCRIPLPWTTTGSSFGFGPGGSHLPMPADFGKYSVEANETDANSVLNLYRAAIAMRKGLQCAEEIKFIFNWNRSVLHFARPNGWQSFTNFGKSPVKLPKGKVLLSSRPLIGSQVPGETTVWLQA